MRKWNVAAIVAALGVATILPTGAQADAWTESYAARPVTTAAQASPSKARSSKPKASSENANDYSDESERPQRRGRSKGSSETIESAGSLSGGTTGIASYYWQPQRVASGGWFNPNAYTAAHKTLPFGTRVRVTHLGNGRSVDVTINDRGPYIAGRIIDLSKAAAGAINMQGQGVAQVRVVVLGR